MPSCCLVSCSDQPSENCTDLSEVLNVRRRVDRMCDNLVQLVFEYVIFNSLDVEIFKKSFYFFHFVIVNLRFSSRLEILPT